MGTFPKLKSVISEWHPEKKQLHSPDIQGQHQELPGSQLFNTGALTPLIFARPKIPRSVPEGWRWDFGRGGKLNSTIKSSQVTNYRRHHYLKPSRGG